MMKFVFKMINSSRAYTTTRSLNVTILPASGFFQLTLDDLSVILPTTNLLWKAYKTHVHKANFDLESQLCWFLNEWFDIYYSVFDCVHCFFTRRLFNLEFDYDSRDRLQLVHLELVGMVWNDNAFFATLDFEAQRKRLKWLASNAFIQMWPQRAHFPCAKMD